MVRRGAVYRITRSLVVAFVGHIVHSSLAGKTITIREMWTYDTPLVEPAKMILGLLSGDSSYTKYSAVFLWLSNTNVFEILSCITHSQRSFTDGNGVSYK